jgi:hypothetical protein
VSKERHHKESVNAGVVNEENKKTSIKWRWFCKIAKILKKKETRIRGKRLILQLKYDKLLGINCPKKTPNSDKYR